MHKTRALEILLLISLIIIVLLFYSIYKNDRHQAHFGEGPIDVPEVLIPQEYGIILDSLEVFKAKIGRNEFLAEILSRQGVDYARIEELVKISKPTFNVRKIRRGNTYSMITTRDSLKKPLYFVYEMDPVNFLLYDLRDTIRVTRGKKKETRVLETASGRIESSLWNAMIDNETDPNLANELSEIFAWTIDFFGIQKGDSYKVIYEDRYVKDERIGLGRVLAACFNHMGEDHFAYYFVQDSTGDYFDDEAGSMRRTFLKAPLRFRRISSGFSYNRLHPVLKIYRPHTGVDYAADYGTPVHAVGDGVITMAAWTRQGGRAVKIRHNGTYTTVYMHLSAYGKGIKKGAKVKQGDVIGYVGSSGLATGPHLDFRFYRNGQPINPLKVESPPSEPVDSLYLEPYYRLRDELKEQLDAISINE
ncbi:MAG: peptidoglycan DD-metalloendopeptidase family protein [Bacteroidota bacterium]|nr:peptidoglycan DD-metalloendopeptidase family protein [Bacteroidota bacterium]